MDICALELGGVAAVVSRSGYTGEDGFEIRSAPRGTGRRWRSGCWRAGRAAGRARGPRFAAAGGGALPLRHDIDRTTTPVEAALEWAIQPARRAGGARAGGFPGAEVILGRSPRGLRGGGWGCCRRGGRRCARGRSFSARRRAAEVGRVTSGGFGPSLDAPVAMGYVAIDRAAPGTRLLGRLRGKMQPVRVAKLPLFHQATSGRERGREGCCVTPRSTSG